jgi:periplasmic protein TonB
MFNELVETQPSGGGTGNRKSYFIVSSLVLFVGLTGALIFSLFAVDLNLDMDDMDMVELIAPVDAPEEKKPLPELETAPKPVAKSNPGPSAAPVVTTRQANIARIDETPTEVPMTVSTAATAQKAQPSDRFFKVGEFDNDGGSVGEPGRGPGGNGNGDGDGLSTETVAVVTPTNSEKPPPAVKPKKEEKPVIRSLGIVNGRATSLPKPSVPAAAKVANVLGTVAVQVLIDENGNVISANAVSGNQLLRQSSEAAAKQAKFIPTLLSGEKVKASGVINYHFS